MLDAKSYEGKESRYQQEKTVREQTMIQLNQKKGAPSAKPASFRDLNNLPDKAFQSGPVLSSALENQNSRSQLDPFSC